MVTRMAGAQLGVNSPSGQLTWVKALLRRSDLSNNVIQFTVPESEAFHPSMFEHKPFLKPSQATSCRPAFFPPSLPFVPFSLCLQTDQERKLMSSDSAALSSNAREGAAVL